MIAAGAVAEDIGLSPDYRMYKNSAISTARGRDVDSNAKRRGLSSYDSGDNITDKKTEVWSQHNTTNLGGEKNPSFVGSLV